MRYVRAHKDIDYGNYDPDVQPMWIVALVVAALGVMSVPLIFCCGNRSFHWLPPICDVI